MKIMDILEEYGCNNQNSEFLTVKVELYQHEEDGKPHVFITQDDSVGYDKRCDTVKELIDFLDNYFNNYV